MKVKKVKIGDFETENNVFFAPLAGFSDFAMREICKEYGAGLTFTEMVSAKGLCYNNENTVDLLYTTDAEKVKAVQIFGSEPEFMRMACESEQLEKFDIVRDLPDVSGYCCFIPSQFLQPITYIGSCFTHDLFFHF